MEYGLGETSGSCKCFISLRTVRTRRAQSCWVCGDDFFMAHVNLGVLTILFLDFFDHIPRILWTFCFDGGGEVIKIGLTGKNAGRWW